MKILHYLHYAAWLIGEILLAGLTTASLVWRKNAIDPVIVHYPLRVTSEWDIFWFSTSITATPGTLSLGLRHPAHPGEPMILLVHAVEGSDPDAVFSSLAQMEARLNPSVAHLSYGVPGQGDFSGSADPATYGYPIRRPQRSEATKNHESSPAKGAH